MFFGFILIVALGLVLIKLGSYSVWMVVLSTVIKFASIVIAVLVAALIWNKYIQRNFQLRVFEDQKIKSKDS